MFKTDDKLVQICLAVSYAILALYGMINYFNPEYIINNYASLESNDTNRFFLRMVRYDEFWCGRRTYIYGL